MVVAFGQVRYVVRFVILTVVLLKIKVFWAVRLCHLVTSDQHFVGACCFCLQGQAVQEEEPCYKVYVMTIRVVAIGSGGAVCWAKL
jgi:hypothetical protein